MGFFQSIGSKVSGAANWLGRKAGQAAQFVGNNKVSDVANKAADVVSKIPIISGASDAIRSVGDVGRAAVDVGKALVGGHGGLKGAGEAIGRGVNAAENSAKQIAPMFF